MLRSDPSQKKIVLNKVPMLNLAKMQSSKNQSYKRDAANLLVNRLNKKLRTYFEEIKDFAAFQEVCKSSISLTLLYRKLKHKRSSIRISILP